MRHRPTLLLPDEIRDRENGRRAAKAAVVMVVALVLGGIVATKCEGEAHAEGGLMPWQPEVRSAKALESIDATLKAMLQEMKRR